MQREVIKANIVVFIASFCTLVIELVAGRIMAPYVGVSLYTWTSIIGVVLAGISIGAYLGGLLADRYPRASTLGWLLFLSGLGASFHFTPDQFDRRGPIPYQFDDPDPPDYNDYLFRSFLPPRNDLTRRGEADAQKSAKDRQRRWKDLCLLHPRFYLRDICHWILPHLMDGNSAHPSHHGNHPHPLRSRLRRFLC